jgi:hypothetical protein
MKSNIRILMLTLAIATSSTACEQNAPESSPARTGATPEKDEPKEHGNAGAKPGSHEDWCGEHEVPESLCTRCNPSLVPAFKATGDWCEEHGLPESQCLACNPDLKIERPPQQAGGR